MQERKKQFPWSLKIQVPNHSINSLQRPLQRLPHWITESSILEKLMPDQDKMVEKDIFLPYGFDDEFAELQIVFRDPKNRNLQEIQLPYQTKGHNRPLFSYNIELIDGGSETSKGNNDGIPDEGEIVELKVRTTNIGKGPSRGGYFRLKNLSRKYADLQVGTINLGKLQNLDTGESCEEGQDNCYYILPTGETHEGVVRIELRSEPTKTIQNDTGTSDDDSLQIGNWEFEVVMADNYAYDYATIMKGGFGRYYQQKQELNLVPKNTFQPTTYTQPNIEVLSKPDLIGTSNMVQISGILHDGSEMSGTTEDSSDIFGIEEVIVFHNENKIYYKHEPQVLSKVPFVVDAQVEEGENHFYILLRNKLGLTHTKHISYFLQSEMSVQE